jgi:uncharacterized protein
MTDWHEEPESPCISVCALDENDVCVGCFRSGQEVTDWFFADPARKLEILDAARERRLASGMVLR